MTSVSTIVGERNTKNFLKLDHSFEVKLLTKKAVDERKAVYVETQKVDTVKWNIENLHVQTQKQQFWYNQNSTSFYLALADI